MEHTIEADFKVDSALKRQLAEEREERIIKEMAKAIGGNPCMALFEAKKIYCAIMAMQKAFTES